MALFEWLNFEERGGRTAFGKMLRKFNGRILGNIRLRVHDQDKRRPKLSFECVEEQTTGAGTTFVHGLLGAPQDQPTAPPVGDIVDIVDIRMPALAGLNNPEDVNQGVDNIICRQRCNAEVDNIDNVANPGQTPGGWVEPIAAKRSASSVFILITAKEQLPEVAQALRDCTTAIALDIETYSQGGDALNPFRGEIRLLSLAIPGHPAWLIDLDAVGYALAPLKEMLEVKEIIGHNLKFDCLWLLVKCGLRLPKVFCTMTASRLLTAGTNTPNDLGACLSRHLTLDLPKDLGNSQWASTTLTPDQLVYAANDVGHLHRLREALERELKSADLDEVVGLEMTLLPVVVDMEFNGVPFNRGRAEQLLLDSEAAQAELLRELHKSVCDNFNPNSTAQVKNALQAVGVNVTDTKEQTLAACPHPLAAKILDYRAASSPVRQVHTLLKALSPDGRIHGSFNPTGTDTGRFSSSKPNLQNIGRGNLRSCIAAPEGAALVVADYSQIELRIAAQLAEEEGMLGALQRGEDLHVKTAGSVLGKPESQITKDDRQLAKAVNFGLLYGQSAKGLVDYARMSYGVNLTLAEAERIRGKFFNTYPRLKRWHEGAWRKAKNRAREVRTVLGRRRRLLSENSDWSRFTALVNTPVQGGAADGLKMAMVELARRLPSAAKIILTIHDEIVVLSPLELAERVKEILGQVMTEAMTALFPQTRIEVDVKICRNWGEK